uniref:Rhodanese-related sulfurtransferase n=1 Tax=uncultured marine thaumarchaeote KM3_72_F07 TaxID=1456263 RepID=A0A075HJI9_9ARCH|nr:Rhodanese-related sulfurtransferase [uncultured marine thaumarchaeote KM3_72_F07]
MVKSIKADELKKNRKDYVLIDVREQEELLGGSIDDSVHLPLGQLIRKVRKTEKDEFNPDERHQLFLVLTKQVDVKKSIDKKICTYCSFGYRGGLAADELAKSGIKADIVNLDGGFAAWENQNGNSGTKTY